MSGHATDDVFPLTNLDLYNKLQCVQHYEHCLGCQLTLHRRVNLATGSESESHIAAISTESQ